MDRLTREEVAGAVARGYCTTANMYKELDADLITGITNEVMALLQSLSREAVRDEAQNSIDAGRYRHWRNAKVGEASHDYHFDDLLGKIENACDLAHEIDAAIDADMQRLGKQP